MIASFIILAILAFAVVMIIRKMVNDKKNGNSSCGCGCSSCSMKDSCHKIKED